MRNTVLFISLFLSFSLLAEQGVMATNVVMVKGWKTDDYRAYGTIYSAGANQLFTANGLRSGAQFERARDFGIATDGKNNWCTFLLCEEKGTDCVEHTRSVGCFNSQDPVSLGGVGSGNRWGDKEYTYADIAYDPISSTWCTAESYKSNNFSIRLAMNCQKTEMGATPSNADNQWSSDEKIRGGNRDDWGWDSNSINSMTWDVGLAGYAKKWCATYGWGHMANESTLWLRCKDENGNWSGEFNLYNPGIGVERNDLATNGKYWCSISRNTGPYPKIVGSGNSKWVKNKAGMNVYNVQCSKFMSDPAVQFNWREPAISGSATGDVSITTDGSIWAIVFGRGDATYERHTLKPGDDPGIASNWSQERAIDSGGKGARAAVVSIAAARFCFHAGEQSTDQRLCCPGLTLSNEKICQAPVAQMPETSSPLPEDKCNADLAKDVKNSLEAAAANYLAYEALFTSFSKGSPFSDEAALSFSPATINSDEFLTYDPATLKQKNPGEILAMIASLKDGPKKVATSELVKRMKDVKFSSAERLMALFTKLKIDLKGVTLGLKKLQNDYSIATDKIISMQKEGTTQADKDKLWAETSALLELNADSISKLKDSNGKSLSIEQFSKDAYNTSTLIINAKMEKDQEEYFLRVSKVLSDPEILAALESISFAAQNEEWNCKNSSIHECGRWSIFDMANKRLLANPLLGDRLFLSAELAKVNNKFSKKLPILFSDAKYESSPDNDSIAQSVFDQKFDEKFVSRYEDSLYLNAQLSSDSSAAYTGLGFLSLLKDRILRYSSIGLAKPDDTELTWFYHATGSKDFLTDPVSIGGVAVETRRIVDSILSLAEKLTQKSIVAAARKKCLAGKVNDFSNGIKADGYAIKGGDYTTLVGDGGSETVPKIESQVTFTGGSSAILGGGGSTSGVQGGVVGADSSGGGSANHGNLGKNASISSSADATLSAIKKSKESYNKKAKTLLSGVKDQSKLSKEMENLKSKIASADKADLARLARIEAAGLNSKGGGLNSSSSSTGAMQAIGVTGAASGSDKSNGAGEDKDSDLTLKSKASTGSGSGSDAGSLGLYSNGQGGNSSDGSGGSGAVANSAAESEEEKNQAMLRDLEKQSNKELKSAEGDTLFKQVSKAYLRSYPKVLKVKKE